MVRKKYLFYGMVQGVGFRYRAKYAAERLGLTGWVYNCFDGSVEMEVQGEEKDIVEMIEMIGQGTYVSIDGMKEKEIPLEEERGFHIR